MRKTALVMTLLSSVLATPAFADDATCKAFATTMIKRVVDIFHDAKQSEQQKRQSLSVVFQDAVDTDWIGRFVLGRFWREATSQQQAAYLKSYRIYITNSYVSKFKDEDGMSVDDITLTSITPKDANEFDAKTLIKRHGDDDAQVNYLLDNSSGKCKVHDIQVEGVSLLTSQRSEFTTLAGSSGVNRVIEALQKKTGK